MQCLLQGVEHKAGLRSAADPPADDTPGESVDHEGHVDEARPGGNIGKIRDPQGVRPWRLEPTLHQVQRARRRAVSNGGPDLLAASCRRPTAFSKPGFLDPCGEGRRGHYGRNTMTRRSCRWIAGLVAVAMSAAPVAGVRSQDDATGVVKERMEMMERLDELMDRVFAMLHGELPYDADTLRRDAEEIRGAAGAEMTRLFPEGSGGKPSEARPEIWTDFATFSHFAERLGWTAEMLARAADDPGEDIALPRKWEDVAMGPGMMGGRGPRADMGPGAMMGEADRGRGMMRGEGPGRPRPAPVWRP